MKRIDLALCAGLAVSVFLTSFVSFARDCGELRQSVVRLHILANSDSEADQTLKLEVRDAILAETSELFESALTKEQAEEAVSEQLNNIEAIAENVMRSRGYNYDAKAELVNMFFETRVYGDTMMPAGRYDAVRVKIGEAKGKNWWCVMFPPLCLPAASEKSDAELGIQNLGSEPKYVPKFAILELVEKLTQSGEDTSLEISG